MNKSCCRELWCRITKAAEDEGFAEDGLQNIKVPWSQIVDYVVIRLATTLRNDIRCKGIVKHVKKNFAEKDCR